MNAYRLNTDLSRLFSKHDDNRYNYESLLAIRYIANVRQIATVTGTFRQR